MVTFVALIRRFEQMGEKTGWTYVDISADIAQQLNPEIKRSFRVKGMLDRTSVNGLALLPMGGGSFILPLNASLREKLKKVDGSMLELSLEADQDFRIDTPEDLRMCLQEEGVLHSFDKLPKSHRNYFINWISSAKMIETRTKRMGMTVNAMLMGSSYAEMIRQERTNNDLG